MIPCETATTALSTDNQGRAWEHFWLGDRYQFSNQIPNLKSFTRTEPGWVLADNGYCQWSATPPQRMRTDTPAVQAQTEANSSTPTARPTSAGMADGGFGVLVLLAAVAAGGWYWVNRDKEPDSDYHPMADIDWQLPALPAAVPQPASLPDELEWNEGDPIPPGYELIDDGEDEGDEEDDYDPKFERSPFLPVALRDQIRAEAEAAARNQAHSAFMQGTHLMERVYPRSQRPQPATATTRENLVLPAFQLVEPPVAPPVAQAVEAEIALFEETVKAFTPIPLDPTDGVTREAVREALRLGKSQNWITANLFEVTKATKAYEQAVAIIKHLQEA